MQSTQLRMNGHSYLNFCSNDYLGLAAHPALRDGLLDSARQYGVGAGAAHLVNGHQRAHHALEQQLANYTRRPRSLLFSTGYMANGGTLSALLNHRDAVFMDKLNHASLIDGALLSRAKLQRYRHTDPNHLEELLRRSSARHKIIATDGVFSMDGDIADLPALAELARRYEAWLMVDDAHGLGVIGKNGGGCVEHFALDVDAVPILMGTLGKAFGSFGAFVAGSDALIEYLIQFARSYIYTTALPPAIAAATSAALRIAESEAWRRQHLRDLITLFRAEASQQGWTLMPSATPIQPILLGDSEAALQLSQSLFTQGILVTAIRPPTVPKGSARLRVTLSAAHTADDVARLCEALGRCHGV